MRLRPTECRETSGIVAVALAEWALACLRPRADGTIPTICRRGPATWRRVAPQLRSPPLPEAARGGTGLDRTWRRPNCGPIHGPYESLPGPRARIACGPR